MRDITIKLSVYYIVQCNSIVDTANPYDGDDHDDHDIEMCVFSSELKIQTIRPYATFYDYMCVGMSRQI